MRVLNLGHAQTTIDTFKGISKGSEKYLISISNGVDINTFGLIARRSEVQISPFHHLEAVLQLLFFSICNNCRIIKKYNRYNVF